jgi:hypothetical protein
MKRQNCHADLPPFASIEATGVSILIGKNEVLFAAICKSQGHAWNAANITELDISHYWQEILNTKHSF